VFLCTQYSSHSHSATNATYSQWFKKDFLEVGDVVSCARAPLARSPACAHVCAGPARSRRPPIVAPAVEVSIDNGSDGPPVVSLAEAELIAGATISVQLGCDEQATDCDQWAGLGGASIAWHSVA
jgi:hypothetical protein